MNELENEIVTLTTIQIALKAEAPSIQANLSQLVMEVDIETDAGLWQLFQGVLSNVLENYQYWTHFLAESQTLTSRESAQNLFETISHKERRKFKTETLSNIDGKITQTTAPIDDIDDSEAGERAYIVVTLLIGTAHDEPLFNRIHSGRELKEALDKVALMSPDYLLIFELLWSPQVATDSLSESNLRSDYADLVGTSALPCPHSNFPLD
jgi:uncharacterized membrane protein